MKSRKNGIRSGGLHNVVVIIAALSMLFFAGCEKEKGEQKKDKGIYLQQNGVFIVNEGQFMAGNGDISFYDKVSGTVQNNLFFSVNNRPPGDIPQYMAFYREEAWLVVNNSNTLEVIGLDSFRVLATIGGLEMPRQMKVHGNFGYVSQLGSGNISRINLSTRQVVGHLAGEKSSDHLLIAGNRLFAANWTSFFINKPNNTVMVYDLSGGVLEDSVVVAKEPNSMVRDANGKIWVLSSGGFMGEEYPALTCFDPNTLQVIKVLEFPDKGMSPSLLTASPDGKTLYFVNGDVYSMDISSQLLPQTSLIPSGGRSIYGLSADPKSGDLYLADARDFQQNGKVYRYTAAGVQRDVFDAGIIPSGIFFYQP